jgi:hypothetical protein
MPTSQEDNQRNATAAGVALSSSGRVRNDVRDWHSLATDLLLEADPTLRGILDTSDPRATREQQINRLGDEIARLRVRLNNVPSDECVVTAEAKRRTVTDLGTVLRPVPPAQIYCESLQYLEDTLYCMNTSAARNLPIWSFSSAEGQSREDAMIAVLGDKQLLQRFAVALDWVARTFSGAPPSNLLELPPPAVRSDVIDQELEAAWRRAEALAAATTALPPSCQDLFRLVSPNETLEIASQLGKWHRALHLSAFAEMVAALAQAADVVHALAALPKIDIVTSCGDEDRADLKEAATFRLAQKMLLNLASVPVEPGSAIGQVSASKRTHPVVRPLEFGHVVTDDHGRVGLPTVFVPPSVEGERCVFLELPVRVMADLVATTDLVVLVTSTTIDEVPPAPGLPDGLKLIKFGERKALEWTLPADPLRWRQIETSGRWGREEVLTVPVTLGLAQKLRRVGELTDMSLKLAVGNESSQLTFSKFATTLPAGTMGTGVGYLTASQLVVKRPLGAQMAHVKLEGIVAEGRKSFMVVAPRRFGKTILFQHLAEHATDAGHHVIRVEGCRALSPEEAAKAVWDAIQNSLVNTWKSAPPQCNAPTSLVSDWRAWERIQEFVGQRGKRSIVLLIDEAQDLVPRCAGPRWGNQFKQLVDNLLFQSVAGRAIVQIALFGTVDLKVRMGQNCATFLLQHGSARHDFDETSLARYLREVGQGAIDSSRAARLELVDWANNLVTLEEVVSRVRENLNGRRLFILDSDVKKSIEGLLGVSKEIPEDLWNYARAEMSFHDEPWDPVDAFPLAVAWARYEVQDLGVEERLDASLTWLNAELQSMKVQATVPVERCKQALADLRSRGVISNEGPEFRRPLLRELLRRKSGMLRTDDASQLALMRLAVDTVAWPDGLQERGGGGQAKVFLSEDGAQAYRACQLDTDDSRRGFARTCAAIRTIRDNPNSLPRNYHLPRVSQCAGTGGCMPR